MTEFDKFLEEYIQQISEAPKALSHFYSIGKKMFPEETYNFLLKNGVDVIKLKETAVQVVSCIDKYKIDPIKKLITVKDGDKSSDFPLINITSYVRDNHTDGEENKEYFFLLSFYLDPEIFNLFQLNSVLD
jgi:hypothetical protein